MKAKRDKKQSHRSLFVIEPELIMQNMTKTEVLKKAKACISVEVSLKDIPADCDPSSYEGIVRDMLLDELPRLIDKLRDPGFIAETKTAEPPFVMKQPINNFLH